MRLHVVFLMTIMIGLCVCPTSGEAQAWRDEIGWTDLFNEIGASLEDGSGVQVMQAEAPSSGNHMPNLADSEFTGKTITNGSPAEGAGTSSHSNSVARQFVGNTVSIASGITDLTVFEANDYINRILLNSGGDPLAQGFQIGNHSYIGNGLTASEKIDLFERFDFVINRDNTVMTVGANNGAGNTTPDLMAPSLNAITVGVSDGTHSRGETTDYHPGRFKPDIVAPANFTSFSTPIVASAAAILRQAGSGSNAEQNEAIRALLFAGATKEEFADWDRTTTRPIDEVYGFGELNIFNSYQMLQGGEFEGSTTDPVSNVDPMGWDYGDFDGVNDLFYDFDVAIGEELTQLSAALTWNIDVQDNDADTAVFDATSALANLDLFLYDSTGSFLGSLVDSSVSTNYNNEHIYLNGLAAGSYTFRITGDSSTDFGFAWRMTAVPEPNGLVILALLGLGYSTRRRKCA